MATLGNCAALFEVGFGVSAVGLAAELYFKRARRQIARQLFHRIRPSDSHISGVEAERAFERFVFQSSGGLKIARWIYLGLVGLAVAAIGISLLGLIQSAVRPNYSVSDVAVWIYATVSILILPLANWLYRKFLGWLQPAFAGQAMTPAEAKHFWRAFELVLPIPGLLREMREATNEARTFTRRLRRQMLRDRAIRWLDRLKSWFR